MMYIQVDKETKRVQGYGSTKNEEPILLEIEIDETDEKYSKLLSFPFIYIYDESKNEFILDSEYKEELKKEKENYMSPSQKIDNVVSSLASSKLELMQTKKQNTNLTNQLSLSKIELMQLKNTNLTIVKELAEMKIKLAQQQKDSQGGN